MAFADHDEYINAQPEPKRTTLLEVRNRIREVEPRLEEVIAWNSPQFKFEGKYAVGLCAFKNHLTFSPQSPAVLEKHSADLSGFVVSKSSFQFPVDQPLSRELLEKLIRSRLNELRN